MKASANAECRKYAGMGNRIGSWISGMLAVEVDAAKVCFIVDIGAVDDANAALSTAGRVGAFIVDGRRFCDKPCKAAPVVLECPAMLYRGGADGLNDAVDDVSGIDG